MVQTQYTVHHCTASPEFHQGTRSQSPSQSLVTGLRMRCSVQASLAITLALVASITAVKTTTNDYLQPYKFVKPLKDLEDLYMKTAEDKTELSDDDSEVEADDGDELVPDQIQSRSGEALLEAEPLMTDNLSPPAPAKAEALPKPQPLTSRKRQRVAASSRHELRDRMSNHKIDDEEEEEEEEVAEKKEEKDTKSPVAEALRSPGPPIDNEEYYYYDDDYYEYEAS